MKRDEKVKLILEECDEESATAMSIFAQTVLSVEATSGIERHFVDSLMPKIATDENKIIELMGVPDEEHDLDGLREALQASSETGIINSSPI